jgi:hypothetical protein
VKGTTAAAVKLALYRHRDGRDERLANGARAGRGDLVQMAYVVAHAPSYGVIVSLDGGGQVTLHLPDAQAGNAPPLQTSREVRLSTSYELDDAPGFERFFLVTAPAPFPIGDVMQAARALAGSPAASTGPLPLPATFWQASLRLEKTHKEQP